MNNTLLFHIGRMKTGTTALQVFLYENAEKLKQYGWCYPDLVNELPEIKSWDVMNRGKNGTIFYTEDGRINESSDNWNKPWITILEYLKYYNVIISSEDIANRDTEKFLKLAKKKYDNIKVVIYLRRQDLAVESAWNQEIKGDWVYNMTIHEYLTEDVIESLHYLRQLDEISNIIGKNNLIVRIYEKQQFLGVNHTIMSDFLSIIGVEANWEEWAECKAQNPRLLGNYFEIKNIFNSGYFSEGSEISNSQYEREFVRLSQEFNSVKRNEGYFTKQERKEILEKFELENEQIARKYLQRDSGILFYDKRMDYTVCDVNRCTPMEKDMIRVFSALICSQNQRMKEEIAYLKVQYSFLMKKYILRNKKDREVILFGAGHQCRELLRMGESFSALVIADNDKKKTGKKLFGKKIIYAKDIRDWTVYFVLITCFETKEIEKQLISSGLKKEKDYILLKEYLTVL